VTAALASLPPAGRLDARAFNVGTGVATSVLALADALQRAAGRRTALEFAAARPGEQQRSYVRIEKAARVLGWRPTVALEQGLAETFEWFRTHQVS